MSLPKWTPPLIEHLEEALLLGAGESSLFQAHLGPFEYLSSWFSAHGYEMVIRPRQ